MKEYSEEEKREVFEKMSSLDLEKFKEFEKFREEKRKELVSRKLISDLEFFFLKSHNEAKRKEKQRIRELQRQTKSPKNKKERKKAKLAKQSRKTNR